MTQITRLTRRMSAPVTGNPEPPAHMDRNITRRVVSLFRPYPGLLT